MNEWESKLESCPFCRGKAQIQNLYRALGAGQVVWPECKECGARMPDIPVTATYCAYDKAVEMWNRRVNNG